MRAAKIRSWGYASKTYHENNVAKYKLTRQTWTQLWEEQKGCCAICKVEFAHPTEKALNKEGAAVYVDHLHYIGETRYTSDAKVVRGLLCFNCNTALGVIKENHTFLRNALLYLQQKGTSTFEEAEDSPLRAKPAIRKFYEVEVTEENGEVKTIQVEYT